ncbi:response regulator [Mucilaginibacter sp. KACC 22063]|uniref:response regulator n=1 Tax=Mucilaginibacter sp. KACC 22063 TaxID=3025666 RepID=UPI0023652FFC|nr:response regulator [Mucilaginibacter sp. KACC 22063]WDF54194.1 response regulator [Mucilaginibacter sp. KACC 22063]
MKLLNTKKRVLLLDKDNGLINNVDELLFTGEWDVFITFDPNAVFDCAKKFNPDLIILDYTLLDNDCALICQDFKQDSALQNIPIIILTAYKTSKVTADSYKCDALFVKPRDFEVLAAKMDILLAS